jgi:hypothetical protein
MTVVEGDHADELQAGHAADSISVPPCSKEKTMPKVEDPSMRQDLSAFQRQRNLLHEYPKLRPVRKRHQLKRRC